MTANNANAPTYRQKRTPEQLRAWSIKEKARREREKGKREQIEFLITHYRPFIEQGYQAIRIHRPVTNPITGKLECSCEEARRTWFPRKNPGEPYEPCPSPAKHPTDGKAPPRFSDMQTLEKQFTR